jgi:hypothetical protein
MIEDESDYWSVGDHDLSDDVVIDVDGVGRNSLEPAFQRQAL